MENRRQFLNLMVLTAFTVSLGLTPALDAAGCSGGKCSMRNKTTQPQPAKAKKQVKKAKKKTAPKKNCAVKCNRCPKKATTKQTAKQRAAAKKAAAQRKRQQAANRKKRQAARKNKQTTPAMTAEELAASESMRPRTRAEAEEIYAAEVETGVTRGQTAERAAQPTSERFFEETVYAPAPTQTQRTTRSMERAEAQKAIAAKKQAARSAGLAEKQRIQAEKASAGRTGWGQGWLRRTRQTPELIAAQEEATTAANIGTMFRTQEEQDAAIAAELREAAYERQLDN